jgi:hypothetical protein
MTTLDTLAALKGSLTQQIIRETDNREKARLLNRKIKLARVIAAIMIAKDKLN